MFSDVILHQMKRNFTLFISYTVVKSGQQNDVSHVENRKRCVVIGVFRMKYCRFCVGTGIKRVTRQLLDVSKGKYNIFQKKSYQLIVDWLTGGASSSTVEACSGISADQEPSPESTANLIPTEKVSIRGESEFPKF